MDSHKKPSGFGAFTSKYEREIAANHSEIDVLERTLQGLKKNIEEANARTKLDEAEKKISAYLLAVQAEGQRVHAESYFKTLKARLESEVEKKKKGIGS